MLAAIGDASLSLLLDSGRLGLRSGSLTVAQTAAALPTDAWQAIAVTYDGAGIRLYVGGVKQADARLSTQDSSAMLQLAPVAGYPLSVQHFGGSLARFQLHDGALSPEALKAIAANPPDFNLLTLTALGVGWPVQVKAWIGLTRCRRIPGRCLMAMHPRARRSRSPRPIRPHSCRLQINPGSWARGT